MIKNDISQDDIIIAVCKDECHTSLSDYAKDWFKNMGSKEIEKLQYRQGFTFIGRNGQLDGKSMEKRSLELKDKISIQ